MNVKFYLLLPLVLCSFFLMTSVYSQSERESEDSANFNVQTESLQQVKSIYIGDFVLSDSAQRFRLVLEDQLVERGFRVANSPDDGDLSLAGAFTLHIVGRDEEARATVRGKLRNGTRIWGGEFTPRFSWKGSSDMTLRVAMALSDQLREDVDKSR
jgi:hypothetical protein